MKQQSVGRQVLSPCVLLLMLWLPLQGCHAGSYGTRQAPQQKAPPAETAAQQPAARSIQEVDQDIAATKKHIRGLEKYETQQRQIGVINAIADQKSRGWTKGDSKPSYEDLADQAYAQAAATEKEIQRLERKVSELEQEKQQILSQSTGCFPPDALVDMGDGTLKPFGEIVPGDRVLTYDIGYDSVVVRPVVERYRVEANHLYTINGELRTTGGERLLTATGWKKVRDLVEGDAVHVDGRPVKIVSLDFQRIHTPLYNLQVEDTHNFYVVTASGRRYLVHNTGGGGGGGSK